MAIGTLHAMLNLYRFCRTHVAVQEMSSDLVGLHNAVPYTEGWSQAFMAVIVGSIFFSVGQFMYTRRKCYTHRSECEGTGKFCSFASWVQLCYLMVFVVYTTLSRDELGESYFILGVALIHTFDRLGHVGGVW